MPLSVYPYTYLAKWNIEQVLAKEVVEISKGAPTRSEIRNAKCEMRIADCGMRTEAKYGVG
jgi:hypothetical protein